MDDIVFVDEIIGVKIAISDHRSSNMTKESLIKLASDARVAGMLSGKPGIVHLHTGTGKAQLDMLFDIVAETEIPIRTFRPTHLAAKYDAAIRFAKLGGYIDFTCDPDDMVNRSALLVRALREAPAGSVTISTDSNGSLPVWNERNEMIGIGAGHVGDLVVLFLGYRRGAYLRSSRHHLRHGQAAALPAGGGSPSRHRECGQGTGAVPRQGCAGRRF